MGNEVKEQTTLLPPGTAVKIAWALTGNFSKEESKEIATEATKALHDAISDAQAVKDAKPKEYEYTKRAVTEIESSMRTLDTIYKGREVNLKENDTLRGITLSNIENDSTFGQKAQDYIKSIPTMAVTVGAGAVGTETLDALLSNAKFPSWSLWVVGVAFAGLGYLFNAAHTRRSIKQKKELYIKQDYERTKYFEQYLIKVKTTLTRLYLDIDRVHNEVFKAYYDAKGETAVGAADSALQGAFPTMCKFVIEHIDMKLVNEDTWSSCETGIGCEKCVFWNRTRQSFVR